MIRFARVPILVGSCRYNPCWEEMILVEVLQSSTVTVTIPRHICEGGSTVFRVIFIGPRSPWSDLCHGSGCHSIRPLPFWNLTDVTLADEDTNSILTDNANRAIQGNVAMHVTLPGGQLWNQCSSAIWWPNLQPMQVAQSPGQIWN